MTGKNPLDDELDADSKRYGITAVLSFVFIAIAFTVAFTVDSLVIGSTAMVLAFLAYATLLRVSCRNLRIRRLHARFESGGDR